MFMLNKDQLRHLSEEPEILGGMIARLALPADHDGASIDIEPVKGWHQVSTSRLAVQRYGGLQMRSYADPSNSIVLTLVEGARMALFAEGAKWQIETNGAPHVWRAGGHYARTGQARVASPTAAATGSGIDLSRAGMSEQASYTREDFDWIAQISKQPCGAITRLHMLASLLDIRWSTFERSERPTGDMMLAIERALDLPTVVHRDDVPHMPLLARLRAAEDKVFGERHDQAAKGAVETMLAELGFEQVLREDRDAPHEDHWILETGEPERSLLVELENGWTLSRAPRGGEPRGLWVEHAAGLDHARALMRIRALVMRPDDGPVDVTSPSRAQIVKLADATNARVVENGPRLRELETLLNVLAALDLPINGGTTVSDATALAVRAAYGSATPVVTHPY